MKGQCMVVLFIRAKRNESHLLVERICGILWTQITISPLYPYNFSFLMNRFSPTYNVVFILLYFYLVLAKSLHSAYILCHIGLNHLIYFFSPYLGGNWALNQGEIIKKISKMHAWSFFLGGGGGDVDT